MAQGWRARNRVPGLRLHYHAHYYGAFVLDPDAHRIEAVCHTPMSPAIVATGLRRAERNPSSDIRHTSSRAADTVLPRARLHHAAGAHRGKSRPNARRSLLLVRAAVNRGTAEAAIIVSTALYVEWGRLGEIGDLCVLPEHRRRGLTRLLT